MFGSQDSADQPYPEPVDPPSPPPETGPSQAPQEEPPSTPFDDGGRTIDAGATPSTLFNKRGELVA